MKLVIVIDTWSEGNGGVIATKRLVEELMIRGHQVRVVTTGSHEGDFYEIPGFAPAPVRESLENMGMLFGIGKKKILEEAYKNADLVQIQFPFFMSRNAVKVARKMGIPVLGAAHVQPQNIISAMGKESKLMEFMFYTLFNYCLYDQVDTLHCPSQFAADLFSAHGSKADMKIISNGIPDAYIPEEYDRPDWFGDKFVILNIGRHAMEKRQELLIDGVLKSKYKDNIQLLLCGKGEDSDKLRERGKELPVEPLIRYVSMEEKLHYLNTADLYMHASVVELESLSCLEAIGCGLPCLIGNSPYSAAPQFALDDNFIFEMDDADSLARRIDYLYENRESLKNRKKDVLQMAENFRFKKCVDQMEDLYTEILGSPVNIKDKDAEILV
ncbi:glycosyltransferase [Spirochaeta isovalerica]|uniref:Glycosyltransferase involved in cell wall biosynthesis n=1 Tax=Spirochaeta isovalerica TaxID=150 RepID=A0A841R822_9SPIO|nr:glycosyltransferase [Spirochaeta isovalerica]MBB6478888.1 glycosyltransferase involved in cell wall biosynthesis [Spirochaeta isovalerica]